MEKNSFLKGAMILTLAGLMVKVIGSVNRILLSRLLGGEGIGLYQMAYPMYLLLLAVSAAGIPVAISIVVAQYKAKNDYYNVKRVFRISLLALAVLGLVLAVALYWGSGYLVAAGHVSDPRALYGLRALTPAIFFATLLASFRGYFQGQQLMTPPALSQILEQLVRVTTMVLLAYMLLPTGLEYAAAGAAFGAVPGSLMGLLVLGYYYRKHSSPIISVIPASEPVPAARLIKQLCLLALPVSLANIMVPAASSIDMLLVPKRLLAAGYSVQEATTLFGYLAGMAQPLLMMATIPTLSLAASLVPAITEAHTLGQREAISQRAATALRLCALLVVPAAIGMSVLALPISSCLYGTGAAAVAICHAGPAICFLGLQQITAAVLQGMGRSALPMVTMALGLVAKIIAVYFLTNQEYHIAGAAWATNINFALTAALNLGLLAYYKISCPWSSLGRIFLAAALMGAVAYEVQLLTSSWAQVASLALSMAAAIFTYGILLIGLGQINQEDLAKVLAKIKGKLKKK